MTDVLFVDDDAFILSALRRLMKREGFSFMTANSGREALDILESEAIHVVVSDYMMPEMNGAELLSMVRIRWPETIRVILSGYSDKDVINAALSTKVVHRFLMKPWDDEELKKIILELVTEYRNRENHYTAGEGI